ncbi:MAG: hypothetical protein ABIO36_07615 [Pyrinomonadaceae bacterium]
MKLSNSLTILFIVGTVLFSVGFACNSDNSSSTPSNSTTTSDKTTNKSAPKIIAGEYDATGTNPTGTAYKAGLVVTPHDDVYQFTWTSGKNSYDGVGVMSDSEVAVSFTDGGSGKGCGVVLYTINKDGSLDGKIGYWGNNSMETEKATPKSAGSLDGVYDVVGKNPEGKEYKGKLIVIESGDGYTFDWEAGTAFSGYGIRAGDYIAVGFGGKQCSFVGYDVQPDGTLKGKWGSQFARKFGTEIAKKK